LINFNVYNDEIKKLEDKANMMRDMHSYQFQRYEWISKTFSLIVIVLSAIIALLAIADPSVLFINGDYINSFRNWISILAFIIFLLSLCDKIYGINEKAAKHEQAVKVMTDFITKCNDLRKLELESCGEEDIKLKVDSLYSQYSLINHMNPFPTISDQDFMKGKQRHLIKVDISKKLSNNPYENIEKYTNKRYIYRFVKWVKGLLF